jgi:hypothetical protein
VSGYQLPASAQGRSIPVGDQTEPDDPVYQFHDGQSSECGPCFFSCTFHSASLLRRFAEKLTPWVLPVAHVAHDGLSRAIPET